MDNKVLMAKGVDLHYGEKQALKAVDMTVERNEVTALIGPSGCGKSTLLRCFNRMNDTIDGCRVEGSIMFNHHLDGGVGTMDILDPSTDVMDVRTRIGMVFQKPNPFPMSIWDNVAYGPRIHGNNDKAELDGIVERSLRQAALWEEVHDRLDESAMGLSGGQQQRLCIARALAVEPEVLLMDEPTSALDPIATQKVEDLVMRLKRDYTVVIVTHNMQQAARVSDRTGFMYIGEMVEFDETVRIFENPSKELTERYITGRFG